MEFRIRIMHMHLCRKNVSKSNAWSWAISTTQQDGELTCTRYARQNARTLRSGTDSTAAAPKCQVRTSTAYALSAWSHSTWNFARGFPLEILEFDVMIPLTHWSGTEALKYLLVFTALEAHSNVALHKAVHLKSFTFVLWYTKRRIQTMPQRCPRRVYMYIQ